MTKKKKTNKFSFVLHLFRELCDGLHSNVHLNHLDLRLYGNQLELFAREYAFRLATISHLTALNITGCGKERKRIDRIINMLNRSSL